MLESINTGVRRILAVPDEIWHKLERMAVALERTAESAEQHIAEVGALTEAVTTLTQQLNVLLSVMNPVAKAEHEVAKVEHGVVEEIGRVAHLFHPHRDASADNPSADGSPPQS
jgi:hypothetical protein